MKKLVMFYGVILTFLFGMSVAMVHAQAKLDQQWFKVKVSGAFVMLGATGELAKDKGKGQFFLHVGGNASNICGGTSYIASIVSDCDGDGTFESVGGGFLDTCDINESGFTSDLTWNDPCDDIDFDVLLMGIVKGDPSLKSKGCVVTADSSPSIDVTGTGIYSDVVGQKCKLKASDIECEDLPFADQLVGLGFPPCP